jgi:hypothetical protein
MSTMLVRRLTSTTARAMPEGLVALILMDLCVRFYFKTSGSCLRTT